MNTEQLKKLVLKTPNAPGVYRFQDAQKKDIYIGKASSIKKRLASYTKTTDSRIQKMVATAEYLNFIKTESDIEALILESQLIKQQRPQFNIMLRDDKQYFYVAFTADEFPRLFLTHQPESAVGRSLSPVAEGAPFHGGTVGTGSPGLGKRNRPTADFIGPFTDGAALKATLKYLRDIFPYCTCKQKHHNFCLNYHIGKCIGFCCLKNHETQIIKHVTKKQNSDATWYMIHATYLSNIKALRDILNGRRSSLVKELKKEMEIAGKKHDFTGAIELRTKLERLERVFKNARIIKSSAIIKKHVPFLSGILHNTKPIIHIEGYDVSNIQGEHATGAMVTFVNGIPDKNFYRKFNIHPVKSGGAGSAERLFDRVKFGDTQMIAQILERRLNRPEWPFPDLIIVDGGKGQVSSALATLKEMNTSIPVIGLSKNEKHMGHQIIIPGRKQPLPLAKLGLTDKNLLLSIDAEAHRFAISHYRKLHRRSI